MTAKEQVRIPRETFDLMKRALEEACGNRCNAEYNPCYAREALAAAKEVQPVDEWTIRGTLAANLKCWHRLKEDEAAELVRLFAAKEVPQVQEGYDGKGCSNVLRLAGQAYPRTCKACGLGPCRWQSEQAQREAP